MKKVIAIILLNLVCYPALFAQSGSNSFDVKKLVINWELKDNHYQGKPVCLSALTVTNTSKKVFPASGWKIYFNYIRRVEPASVTGNTVIRHINGDVFCLSPEPGFKELKPGESIRIEFVSDEPVLNQTDAPDGLYIVWDGAPDHGQSLTAYTITPIRDSHDQLSYPRHHL